MNELITYWRQGEATQNFGDFLAEYLFEELFLPIPLHPGPTYLIGSVIADFLVQSQTSTMPSVVFWGCGARDKAGLSAEAAAKAHILAVRGPLTASALKLGTAVPRGDPALLLPALYTPSPAASAGGSVCIPHFWDDRTDAEQLAMSGCEQVLRPNLPNSRRRLLEMVDAIASSEFVLSASLHGAIVAAAYGRPFAFWDNGHLDVPFKWQDTAALLGVPAVFATGLTMGRAIYSDQIAPTLRIPSLSPLLFNAPFPLRPETVLRVLAHEWQTQGISAAVLLDWSARLQVGSVEVAAGVRVLGQQLKHKRRELTRAHHQTQALKAEVEAARFQAENKAALSAAKADASEARDAASVALAERDEAERRIAAASEHWKIFSAKVAASFELPLGLDCQALSHQIQLASSALKGEINEARAQTATLKAELHVASKGAALREVLIAELTQARNEALQRLIETSRAEVRLREALHSTAVRDEYKQRFLTEAKAARQTLEVEIKALHEQVNQTIFQRDLRGSEVERLRSKLNLAHFDLSASIQIRRQALDEANKLRTQLDWTCDRFQQNLLTHVEIEQELHSTLLKMGVLEAELIGLNATTTVRAMRWMASTLPNGLKQLLRGVVRARRCANLETLTRALT